MGREIVRRTSPKEPGKRSRLWMQQDIYHVLEKHTGTEDIEVIVLNLTGLKEIRFTTAAFAKMTKLRMLIIISECSANQMQCKVHISDDFKFHYDELRLLFWDRCPLKLLPSDFKSKNLLRLCMPNSHLTQLWKEIRLLKAREVSSYLTAHAMLKEALLDGTAITELPSSMSYATQLVLLDLKNCRKLLSLPSSISKLTLLETLSLSGCLDLGKCQVNSGNLDALPQTLDRLCSLRRLELQNCSGLPSLPALPSSVELINASNCKSLEDISPQSVFLCFGGSIFGNCFKLSKYPSTMERDLQRMQPMLTKRDGGPLLSKITFFVVQQNPNVQVPFSTVFPGSRIPDWFKHRSQGHEINIKRPRKSSLEVVGLPTVTSDVVLLSRNGNPITMSRTVKRCGVCPVYIKSSSDEDYSYFDEGNPSGSDLCWKSSQHPLFTSLISVMYSLYYN
ncbi:putative WRKY transcription factor 19 [Vitis vinifera]|uniref:Putative WRKY transcription factor 19 n=1 Tax=Vitis vinifera TaxID=29760 RepID=A0A438FGH7_VITVI|nr:putative WRKY transcription factor 19 [Vitis vinifera]